jgi:hypothetical protein
MCTKSYTRTIGFLEKILMLAFLLLIGIGGVIIYNVVSKALRALML